MGILLTWPEAVAVVLEATDQVKQSGDTGVTPDLEHVLIAPDGALTILPGSPIPAHPVRQAAGLLTDLLDPAAAPAELRTLAAENQRNPPACVWIEEFTTALAYYERPQRAKIIAALAERAAAQGGSASGDAERHEAVTTAGSSRDPVGFRQKISAWWRRLIR